jgi:hypothetical protein
MPAFPPQAPSPDRNTSTIMSESNVKSKTFLRHTILLVVGVLVVGFVVYRLQEIPIGLKYDATRTFKVGSHDITIETRSFVFGNGDEGHAEVVVSGVGFQEVLDSQFNNDLFMDVRPAYISRADMDGDWRRDLLIWKPANISGLPLTASEYVSSADGELHVLNPPLNR